MDAGYPVFIDFHLLLMVLHMLRDLLTVHVVHLHIPVFQLSQSTQHLEVRFVATDVVGIDQASQVRYIYRCTCRDDRGDPDICFDHVLVRVLLYIAPDIKVRVTPFKMVGNPGTHVDATAVDGQLIPFHLLIDIPHVHNVFDHGDVVT